MKTKKILALALAAVLLVAVSVAGTVAYLLDTTGEITNTFEGANIDIELTETKQSDGSDRGTDDWEAKLIPGNTYTKNPVVSVVRANTDVDIYLFVEFTEEGNPSEYLNYTSTLTGWNKLDTVEDVNNVWYRVVTKEEEVTACGITNCAVTDPHWHLLANDQISVKTDVEKGDMTDASAATLTYKAYAVQKDNLTVENAWANRAQ